MNAALTIAGSDPSGGAGIQLDLKVFRHFGVYGLSALAALTAQNTLSIHAVRSIERNFLKSQLDTLIADIIPAALKTGMLLSEDAVMAVAEAVESYKLPNLVIDPVAVSSTGMRLLEDDALKALVTILFPLTKIVTPNLHEASALTGLTIVDEKDLEKAAREIKKLGPEFVVIKGGHFREDEETLDLLYDGASFYYIRGKRFSGEFHGTGCAYSAALTALLARGGDPIEAAHTAKKFMDKAIENAYSIGKGMRVLNV